MSAPRRPGAMYDPATQAALDAGMRAMREHSGEFTGKFHYHFGERFVRVSDVDGWLAVTAFLAAEAAIVSLTEPDDNGPTHAEIDASRIADGLPPIYGKAGK